MLLPPVLLFLIGTSWPPNIVSPSRASTLPPLLPGISLCFPSWTSPRSTASGGGLVSRSPFRFLPPDPWWFCPSAPSSSSRSLPSPSSRTWVARSRLSSEYSSAHVPLLAALTAFEVPDFPAATLPVAILRPRFRHLGHSACRSSPSDWSAVCNTPFHYSLWRPGSLPSPRLAFSLDPRIASERSDCA